MKPAIISNTGPIVALSGAGHLDLIRQLYTRVIVPESVDIEIKHGGKNRIGLSSYLQADWIQIKPAGTIDLLLINQLDTGEAAVIALAIKEGISSILIDERKARKTARLIYNLNVLGTARILIEAKNAGLIHSVGDVFKRMQQNGYWIHNNIVDYALKIAHEI